MPSYQNLCGLLLYFLMKCGISGDQCCCILPWEVWKGKVGRQAGCLLAFLFPGTLKAVHLSLESWSGACICPAAC